MINQLINRYKQRRTERFLTDAYARRYAFVGMGQHSLSNLYPVLHYLQVPLRYICVTSERKAQLIGRKFPGVEATAQLDAVLADDSIGGVFVAASPQAHFKLACRVLQSGKSLFIEKPPCSTLSELDTLQALQQKHGVPVVCVGLQKRYAPAVDILRKRLSHDGATSYDLHYTTGAYPEGNALMDLYIHPLDLVVSLFGTATVVACQRTTAGAYLLMLRHQDVVGTLELSTAYTWTAAEETLKVCTRRGVYRLSQLDELSFTASSTTIAGIPTEKLLPRHPVVETLYGRNNFTPVMANNQVVSQGFFGEIKAFTDAVERSAGKPLNTAVATERSAGQLLRTSLSAVRPTYELISQLSTL
jgi:virulence factor